jgi:hypothetical protein
VKQCLKCKIKKKNSEFSSHYNTKDKLQKYCRVCVNIYNKEYISTKEGYLKNTLNGAKKRAKKKNLNFNLDHEYIKNITTNICPVFNVNLIYASSNKGAGYPDPHAAALDRIIPELGYVKGNVVFISNWANTIKSNATEKELYLVADWLHEARKKVLNAQTNTAAPIPAGDYQQGEIYPELGPFSATGTWQDDDNIDNYCGADARQDADHRAQASSGDSVGAGNQEVVALEPFTRIEDHGQPGAEIVRLEFGRRYLFDKP